MLCVSHCLYQSTMAGTTWAVHVRIGPVLNYYTVGLCLHFGICGPCPLPASASTSPEFPPCVQGDSFNTHSCWPQFLGELSSGVPKLYTSLKTQTRESSKVPLCQYIPCCKYDCSTCIVTVMLQIFPSQSRVSCTAASTSTSSSLSRQSSPGWQARGLSGGW